MIKHQPELEEKLHQDFPYLMGEVVWAVRNEMARTVEDVLARRLRVLFLDAKASIEMTPKVAEIIAAKLNFDKEWEHQQIKTFLNLAENYQVSANGDALH